MNPAGSEYRNATPVLIAYNRPEPSGWGELHDVTLGRNDELYAVVDEGWRFVVVRMDGSLNVLEVMPFRASVAAGEQVRISGDRWETPMIAYAAQTPSGPRAVLRLIEARTPPTKRRSVR